MEILVNQKKGTTMETIGKPLNPKPWGGHSSFERVVLVQYAGLKYSALVLRVPPIIVAMKYPSKPCSLNPRQTLKRSLKKTLNKRLAELRLVTVELVEFNNPG